jgi:hypothetical protein
MVTDANIGLLYKNPVKAGVAQWTQPIPGGPVYPQQAYQESGSRPGWIVNEQAALFVLGCGHFQNSFTVYFDTYQPPTGSAVPAALFCCGLCSYLQRIVTPVSAIYAENNPILLP